MKGKSWKSYVIRQPLFACGRFPHGRHPAHFPIKSLLMIKQNNKMEVNSRKIINKFVT